ncbi:MEDS domain-containing protein [Actinacidiphila acidipaludis]|uniref:MEDS domain-containing protein n=1 Tax=Actinacidiphila acidipaludis TaxID=2873382 RepID=A0ABS7Q2G9_9ACTN|nr:MEDS domain-containing protein [Streptomyces acidipaludis]MBY8877332.1 MEDS domain-containing protein [Streptomyces acidipaludis]
MRIARSVAGLSPVDVGDHVCWVVPAEDEFQRAARDFLRDGAKIGDKLMVLGSVPPAWLEVQSPRALLIDPADATGGAGWDTDALVSLVGREAEAADRQGFRALRVLAQMERVWPEGTTPQQVADRELRLDALMGGGTAAIVVCAYPSSVFPPELLEQAGSVHPHFTGRLEQAPAFQLFHSAKGHWNLNGVVDADGAESFHAAVIGLLRNMPVLRLSCRGLQLIDASGMQMLVKAADAFPGHRIMVEDSNPTVRKCWELLGFDDPTIPVELAP